jgi:hypothetical protein
MLDPSHQGHGPYLPNKTYCPWNIFRTSGDIGVEYGTIIKNLRSTDQWARSGLSRPGCWAYPDQLMLGVPGYNHSSHLHNVHLTPAESRTQFG